MTNSIVINWSQKHSFNSDEICYFIESAVNETKNIHVYFRHLLNLVQHSTSKTSVRIIAVSELWSMKHLVELNCLPNQIQNFDSEVVLLLCYCKTWFKNLKVWYLWSTAYELSLIGQKLHEWQKGNILGWSVGTCCAIRSSFSMWSKVVLPALSNPKNTSFPLFFIKPVDKHIIQINITVFHSRSILEYCINQKVRKCPIFKNQNTS